jgi:hypothetical protein
MIAQVVILIAQAVVMLVMRSGIVMYAIELVLFAVMIVFNFKPLLELFHLLTDKFLNKRGKTSKE